MLLDSKLLASSSTSEGSSKNKPSIYEQEMRDKRTCLLTEEEFDEERFCDADEDEESIKKDQEMTDRHDYRIKKEEAWDPEGQDNLPLLKRGEVRNPTFLDDDSVKGSIDETKDRGMLGGLVVRNRSKKSSDTARSEETIKGRSNDDSAYDIPDIDLDDF